MHSKEGCSCCKKHLAGLISGIIFAIIAIVHILKLFMGWSITFNGHEVPIWASWVTLVIAIIMAVWDLKICCCKTCHAPKRENLPKSP